MGATANLALPYPENTDPLADMAAAIQALANAVESVHPAKWKRGSTTATTSGSGDLVIPHGLGVTPTTVLVTVRGNSGSNWAVHVIGVDATNFTVRFRVANTGAVVASTAGVACYWQAIA